MKFDRRTLLKGIGAAGATLALSGHASAANGDAQYVVVANGNGVARRLGSGFEVAQELVGGDVLVVHGPADAAGELQGVGGVQAATGDLRFALETPAETATPEADVGKGVEGDWYENLWDKQNSETVAANDVATGEGAQIGIIDTGIDYAHPDLTPNLNGDAGRLFREGEIRSGVEDVVVNNPNAPADPNTDPNPEVSEDVQVLSQELAADVNGHGTHVAGIAAADPTAGVGGPFGDGVQGVAPDAELRSYRAFWWVYSQEAGEWTPTTTTGDILGAIDYGAAQGLDVVNLSLGTPPFLPRENQNEDVRTLRLAYERVVRSAVNRGTVVVASAGNDDADLQRKGRFSLPNSTNGALSISALGPNDEKSFFSNFGTSEIDLGAGGGTYETDQKTYIGALEWLQAGRPLRRSNHPLDEGDEATLLLDEDGNVVFNPNEAAEVRTVESPAWPYPFNLVFSTTSPTNEGSPYGWKAGTSMSAPNVTGLVALVRELDPDASPKHVENALKKNADGGRGRSDPALGAGRIDALDTVRSVAGSGGGNGGGNNGNGNGNGRGRGRGR